MMSSMDHATSKGHIGTKKTIAEVGKLFESVPRSAIDMYVALCLVCHMWKPQTPLKPIVLSGFMTRGQMKGSFEDGGLTVPSCSCAKNRKESPTVAHLP